MTSPDQSDPPDATDPPDAIAPATRVALDRSIRRYPLYAGLMNTWFWMPVFFLYFSEHLTLAGVLRLEAIYYIAVVVLEVPSGSFSDRVGRRPTLLASAASLGLAAGLFLVAPEIGFAAFVVAQILLAAGIAFNSGTDVSFHYDALTAVGRADEFDAREARVSRIGFQATAAGAIVGGAAAMVDLRAPYALSLVAAAISFFVVLGFVEPPRASSVPRTRTSFVAQLRACAGDLRHPGLAWLGAVSVGMVVLNHVPYEFVQPYTRLLVGAAADLDASPAILGVHATVISLIAAAVAGRSIRVRDRVGLSGTMLLGAGLQTAIIGAMAALLHPIVLALVLLRGVPRALMTAPMNAAIAPLVPPDRRATYFSVLSLAGRLSFSGLLVILSLVVDGPGEDVAAEAARGWPELRTVLAWCAGVGGALLIGLTITRRRAMAAGRGTDHVVDAAKDAARAAKDARVNDNAD